MPSINYFFKETYYKYLPHLILGVFITITVIRAFVFNIINDLEYMLDYKTKKIKNNKLFYYISFLIIFFIYFSYFIFDNNQIKYLFLIPIAFLFVFGFNDNKTIIKYYEYFIICLCLILIFEYFFNSFYYFQQMSLPTWDNVLSKEEISMSLVNGEFFGPKYLEYCSELNNCKNFRQLWGNILFDIPAPFYRPTSIYHSPVYFTQLLIFSFLLYNNKVNFFFIIKFTALIFSGSSSILFVLIYLIYKNKNIYINIFYIISIFCILLIFSFYFNKVFFLSNFHQYQFITSYSTRLTWLFEFFSNFYFILLLPLGFFLILFFYYTKLPSKKNLISSVIEITMVMTIIFLIHPDTFKSFFGILFISLSLTYFKVINNYK